MWYHSYLSDMYQRVVLESVLQLTKCKTLHISNKKIPTNARLHHLGDQTLECVPHTKHLGIMISDKLQWADHIENMTAKANKTLGLIKRVCYDINDQSVRKLLYCSLVLPQLEFCSCLWSPYTIKHRALIENIHTVEEPQSLYRITRHRMFHTWTDS